MIDKVFTDRDCCLQDYAVYRRGFFDLNAIDLNAIVVYKITRFIDVNF